MDRFYYSTYGPLIEQFITLKKALGYKYNSGAAHLGRFDRFAAEQEAEGPAISQELIEQWSVKRSNESDSCRYLRIEVVKQFSLFLCQLGHRSYVPRLPRFISIHTPYIFSKEQIRSLFLACDALRPAAYHPKSCIFAIPTVLRLMYATGIRVSEVVSLLYKDVNLEENHITLRNCKNGRERIVALSESIAEACRGYLLFRTHYAGLNLNATERFFMTPGGTPCDEGTIYIWFRKVLYAAGIPHGGKGLGPRLHDLRHTFSVHSLAAMAEAGLDLYHSLPVLSTYLGHQSLAATDKYVRLTADMYPSLIENANRICPYMFPELPNSYSHETY